MHDYHEAHPYYSPAQILHDGCGECAERSANVFLAIEHLDPVAFRTAWHRAVTLAREGLPDVSDAELPLLRALKALAVQFERFGISFGTFPGDAIRDLRQCAAILDDYAAEAAGL